MEEVEIYLERSHIERGKIDIMDDDDGDGINLLCNDLSEMTATDTAVVTASGNATYVVATAIKT